jgi:hypothetical protein
MWSGWQTPRRNSTGPVQRPHKHFYKQPHLLLHHHRLPPEVPLGNLFEIIDTKVEAIRSLSHRRAQNVKRKLVGRWKTIPMLTSETQPVTLHAPWIPTGAATRGKL